MGDRDLLFVAHGLPCLDRDNVAPAHRNEGERLQDAFAHDGQGHAQPPAPFVGHEWHENAFIGIPDKALIERFNFPRSAAVAALTHRRPPTALIHPERCCHETVTNHIAAAITKATFPQAFRTVRSQYDERPVRA